MNAACEECGTPILQPPAAAQDGPARLCITCAAKRPAERTSAPFGEIDLPGLPTISDLPAPLAPPPLADLPMPRQHTDLPAPIPDRPRETFAQPTNDLSDLPAPSHHLDLPGPVQGVSAPSADALLDLPAPSQHIDLPAAVDSAPFRGADALLDLPAPSTRVGLPEPVTNDPLQATSNATKPLVDEAFATGSGDIPVTPGPFKGATPSPLPPPPAAPTPLSGKESADGAMLFDIGTSEHQSDLADEDLDDAISDVPLSTAPGEPKPDNSVPPVSHPAISHPAIKKRPPVALLATGGLLGLIIVSGIALGLFTDLGFFGLSMLSDDNSPTVATQDVLKTGRLALQKDTLRGYQEAAETFAASTDTGDLRIQIRALEIQALSSQLVRFGVEPKILQKAEKLLSQLAAMNESQKAGAAIEIKKAHAVLALARPSDGKTKALTQLGAIANENPRDAMIQLYLGWASLKVGEIAHALTAFKRAHEIDPALSGALLGIARADYALGNHHHALTTLSKLTARAKNTPGSALILHAEVLFALGKKIEAERALRSAENRRPPLAAADRADAYILSARMEVDKGNINKAKVAYQEAIRQDPRHIAAHLGLGKILLHAKNFDAAYAAFRKVQHLDPDHENAGILVAECQLEQGRTLDAKTTIEAVAKKNPTNARALFVLGRVEEAISSFDTAISHYNGAIKLDTKDVRPYLRLSKIYLDRKENSLAFATLRQAETVTPGAAIENAYGEAEKHRGKLGAAQERFEQALRIRPNFNLALFNLADTLHARGNARAAFEHYRKLAARDERFPGLNANMGRLALEMDDVESATDYLTRAIAIATPSVALRRDAARALIRGKKYKEALTQANLALQQDPRDDRANALRAEARLGLSQLGEALVEIRHAIDARRDANYFSIRARIQERLGRTMDAIDSYHDGLSVAPNRIDLRLQRARLLVRSGTVKDGLIEVRTILRSTPRSAEAYLLKGIAEEDLGRERAALASFLNALKYDSTSGEAHLRVGRLYLDRQNRLGALKAFRAAVKYARKADTWRAEANYLLGQTALKQTLHAEAKTAFKTFLEIAGPKDAGRPEAERALSRLSTKQHAAR